MPHHNLICLKGEKHNSVWVNMEKVLYLSEDNSTSHTLCVIHLHGQTTVKVRESIQHVAKEINEFHEEESRGH